jgi:hypothetical protein
MCYEEVGVHISLCKAVQDPFGSSVVIKEENGRDWKKIPSSGMGPRQE